jgi:hypothetical protein
MGTAVGKCMIKYIKAALFAVTFLDKDLGYDAISVQLLCWWNLLKSF